MISFADMAGQQDNNNGEQSIEDVSRKIIQRKHSLTAAKLLPTPTGSNFMISHSIHFPLDAANPVRNDATHFCYQTDDQTAIFPIP